MARRTNHFPAALLGSLLLHVLLVLGVRPPATAREERRIDIEVLSEPQRQAVRKPEMKKPEQIVSPSQAPEQPPKETTLRSERDSRAERETVRRGDPLTAPEKQVKQEQNQGNPSTEQQNTSQQNEEQKSDQKQSSRSPGTEKPPAKTAEMKPERAPTASAARRVSSSKEPERPAEHTDGRMQSQRLSEPTLRLTEREMQAALQKHAPAASTSRESSARDENERARKFRATQPFKPSFTANIFRGNYGTADHLPSIPDGDITLLNAKADRYAVFVRRVALQVFGALRKLNWAELSSGELNRLNDFVTVEAVMSKSGKLLSVSLRESSGSSSFDQIARKAAELGTWDQNPPDGSADADGNIHFIFKSRSWSRALPNGLSEQRWLLLGTGLL